MTYSDSVAYSDSVGPTILLVTPKKDSTRVRESSLNVTITCQDTNGIKSVTCEFNGKLIPIKKGEENSYSVALTGISVGINTLVFIATDNSLNTNISTRKVTINYDPPKEEREGPKITLKHPSKDGSTITTSSLSVTVTCTDISGVKSVTCTLNDKPLTVVDNGDNSYTAGVVGLAAGKNTLVFVATDASSNANKTTDSFSVIYDNAVIYQSKVAGGGYHSLLLKSDGTLWACGDNDDDQLGLEEQTRSITPLLVMSGVMSIAAGYRYSLILKEDGTLLACGDNSDGQLGDGTTADRSQPVLVMSGVKSMAAGDNHSLILKSNGTYSDRLTPVHVMSSVKGMASGGDHSLILKTDGTLWTCGDNLYGQLGDGTRTKISTPVQINF